MIVRRSTGQPQFHQFEIGPMKNFCYFIGAEGSADVFVVDPGWEAERISREAARLGKKITGALCTHSHYDHVNAAEALLGMHDIPVYMLDAEIGFSQWKCENLKALRAGDKLPIAQTEIEILHTPGHTPGSASFLIGGLLVTGDTLFVNGCGRCDLLGGDATTMHETLQKLSRELPPTTLVLPGHDYGPVKTDSLENQKNTNPYLLFDSLESFVQHRTLPRKT